MTKIQFESPHLRPRYPLLISSVLLIISLLTPVPPVQANDNPALYRSLAQRRADTLEATINDIVGTRNMGVAVIPLGSAIDTLAEVSFHIDDQTSVASAFKGPVALYFFENTDPTIWKSVPVRYWAELNELVVPDAYDAAWRQNHWLLRDVYKMLVESDNDSTGNILDYVYREMGKPTGNVIVAFNNWSKAAVGIGDQSGLNAWLSGRSYCTYLPHCTDPRYGQLRRHYRDQDIVLGNSYSPRDLVAFYVRLATVGRTMGYYDTAMEILSIRLPYPSLTKQYAVAKGLSVATKEGFVAPYSYQSSGWWVTTDAGIFTTPDGRQYAVAFMALGSGDLLHAIIDAVSDTLMQHIEVF